MQVRIPDIYRGVWEGEIYSKGDTGKVAYSSTVNYYINSWRSLTLLLLHMLTFGFTVSTMPSQAHLRTSSNHISAPSARTAIIVSILISSIGLIVLGCVFWQRRINRSAKPGTKIGSSSRQILDSEAWPQQQSKDKDLETGVVQEPVPVYRKEVGDGEKVLDTSVGKARSGSGSGRGLSLWPTDSRTAR